MIIRIAQDMSARLDDPNDFKRFSVEIDAPKAELASCRARLTEVGDLVDEGFMWVSQDWLRGAPACAGDQAWQNGVSAMVDAVRKFGWIDEASGAIRAHVMWSVQDVA